MPLAKKWHFELPSCLILLLESCRDFPTGCYILFYYWQTWAQCSSSAQALSSSLDNRVSFAHQESRGTTCYQETGFAWTCHQNLSAVQPLTEEWPYAEVARLWSGRKTRETKLGKTLGFSERTSLSWGAPAYAQLYSICCNCTQYRELSSNRDKCEFFSPLPCTVTFWYSSPTPFPLTLWYLIKWSAWLTWWFITMKLIYVTWRFFFRKPVYLFVCVLVVHLQLLNPQTTSVSTEFQTFGLKWQWVSCA